METGRYIAVHDCNDEELDTLLRNLTARGIIIAARLDFIKAIIITGDASVILELPQTMTGIKSVEPEGRVGIPE
jgi:hypothetical protein